MIYHSELLSSEQLNVLRQLAAPMEEQKFYLGGGTALAIYLGHRHSFDLDWFTPGRLEDALRLAQIVASAGLPLQIGQTAAGTLHGSIRGVRVSWLEFSYPLLQPLVLWPSTGAWLASLDDLACMKLSAIAQRGAKKDFYDVYTLCLAYHPLPELLGLYQKKFNIQDISPLLYGLVYFRDAEEEPELQLLQPVRWRTVKQAFQKWVKEFSVRDLGG